MVRNAQFVEDHFNICEFGKKAQNGYDLSLKVIKRVGTHGEILKDKTIVGEYTLLPFDENNKVYLTSGVYSLTFNEGGRIPEKHCGWIKTRSSLVRNGCTISSGLYDSGFECDTYGAILFVNLPVTIEKNARIAQLLLFEAEETTDYDGQWNKNKDVK